VTSHKPTVFVVDDDQEVGESIRWLIESVDLAVETFGSLAGGRTGGDSAMSRARPSGRAVWFGPSPTGAHGRSLSLPGYGARGVGDAGKQSGWEGSPAAAPSHGEVASSLLRPGRWAVPESGCSLHADACRPAGMGSLSSWTTDRSMDPHLVDEHRRRL
jgi:hypothetical protein